MNTRTAYGKPAARGNSRPAPALPGIDLSQLFEHGSQGKSIRDGRPGVGFAEIRAKEQKPAGKSKGVKPMLVLLFGRDVLASAGVKSGDRVDLVIDHSEGWVYMVRRANGRYKISCRSPRGTGRLQATHFDEVLLLDLIKAESIHWEPVATAEGSAIRMRPAPF